MIRRKLLIVTLALVAVVGGFLWLRSWLHTPLAVPSSGHIVMVPPGTSLGTVAQRLEAAGVLTHPRLLALYARITGEASRIRAGEYELAPGLNPQTLLQQLVEGRVKLHSLTIVEGWTIRDLLRAIRANPAIRQTLKVRDETGLAPLLGLPVSHPEGQFFPDTYRFPRGTSDREVLMKAHELMELRLSEAWQGRAENIAVKTPYEALTLASIVEKETALDRERPMIAGVFSRRLKKGMRLQADPTVIYGLGEEYTGNLTRRHLEKDTPYNSYTRTGLPPGPVSMPGESSLLAALHPDDSDTLYFVATGEDNGGHVFSANLRDHNAAVRRYLGELRERDK